jgi:transcriptional repressor NF-X1
MDNTERPSSSALSISSVGLLTPTGGGGGLPTESNINRSRRNNPRRPNRGPSAQDRPVNPAPRPQKNRRPRDATGNLSVSQQQRATSVDSPAGGGRRQRSPKTKESTTPSNIDHSTPTTSATAGSDAGEQLRLQAARNYPHKNSRRGQFNGRLTEFEPSTNANESPNALSKPSNRYQAAGQKDDLTSTLTHALRTPPYPDCPICFSSIHPAQPTWSCSPSIPISTLTANSGDDSDVPAGREKPSSYCWTTFHVKCIRSWAAKSVKDVSDAWRARGEDRGGDWRCPGCQTKREVVPTGYWWVHFCSSFSLPLNLCCVIV